MRKDKQPKAHARLRNRSVESEVMAAPSARNV